MEARLPSSGALPTSLEKMKWGASTRQDPHLGKAGNTPRGHQGAALLQHQAPTEYPFLASAAAVALSSWGDNY